MFLVNICNGIWEKKISSSFKRLKDLNNGSVCALYVLQDIIRTALFWSLDMRLNLNPQTEIELLIWGRIKLLYMVRNIFWGRYFSLFIIPKDLEILFDTFCTCTFEVPCWSMVSPRKLKSSTLTKGSPFSSNFGLWLIISRWWLWNIMYFVFLTFSDNLFNSSPFCISFSSLFITCGRDTILSGVFCSSLKEQREIVNSKGPRMEPCGTPVVIGNMLEWIPSILIYWVLFVK